MSDRWSIEYDQGGKFERFFSTLGNYEQAVLVAAIENVLEPYGIDICHGDCGKSLGQNLYEFRIVVHYPRSCVSTGPSGRRLNRPVGS